MTLFKQVTEYVSETFRFYNAVYELSRLTDRELADLGMNRYDIPQVVQQSIFNKYAK